MNIQIVDNEKDLQVIIKCKQVNDQIIRLKSHIELFDNKIQGNRDNELFLVNIVDVLPFVLAGFLFSY